MTDISIKPPATVIEWVGGSEDGFVRLLEQTLLPGETTYLDCHDIETLFGAIQRLVVRGAPAIGVAAGYGMVLAGQRLADGDASLLVDQLRSSGEYLNSSRPTAVNLGWAIDRICKFAQTSGIRDTSALRDAILTEARAIHAEDVALCLAIGHNAAPLVAKCSGVLTHCNAGALATAGIGTATAGMYVAHSQGYAFEVYCDETRPLLQGSRLTAWELMNAGIDTTVITDSMAAEVMRRKRVQLVITGADRIAANGDSANKIGTYPLAVCAAREGVDFYIAAPYSTFDMSLQSGREIPIEERASEEITCGFGKRTAPTNAKTFSPAFDVTPAELIKGIITDKGIITPVTAKNVAKVLGM